MDRKQFSLMYRKNYTPLEVAGMLYDEIQKNKGAVKPECDSAICETCADQSVVIMEYKEKLDAAEQTIADLENTIKVTPNSYEYKDSDVDGKVMPASKPKKRRGKKKSQSEKE